MITFRRQRSISPIFRSGVVLLLLCGLVGGFVLYPVSTSASQTDAAMQLLALVNDWRIQEKLWPLKVNPALTQMALDQATYIRPKLATIKEEFEYHLDAQGRTPPERALQSYGWPAYRKSSPKVVPVEIGENAADGSVQFALSFWKSSNIHRKAALSKVYREVGVAAVQSTFGYFFIMDFGARPGVLTPLVSQSGTTLYLPNENSSFVSLQPDQMEIRLLAADGTPMSDVMPWKAKIQSTKGFTSPLIVEYTNGPYYVLSNVDPAVDVINGAGVLKSVENTSTAAPATSTTVPATGEAASETPTPGMTPTAMTLPTTTPTAATVPVTATPQPSTTPSMTPTTPTTRPDLILFYNSRSLVVYNNAGKPVDLTGFSVGGRAGRISVTNWKAVATFSITAFPAGSCLQALQLGATDAVPSQCKFVRSQINLAAAKVFWANGQFTANRNDAVLATCDASAGRCEVRLS